MLSREYSTIAITKFYIFLFEAVARAASGLDDMSNNRLKFEEVPLDFRLITTPEKTSVNFTYQGQGPKIPFPSYSLLVVCFQGSGYRDAMKEATVKARKNNNNESSVISGARGGVI